MANSNGRPSHVLLRAATRPGPRAAVFPSPRLGRGLGLVVVLLVGAASLVVPTAQAAETVRTLTASTVLENQTHLEIDVGIGDVRVVPAGVTRVEAVPVSSASRRTTGARIEVEAELLCSLFNRRCRRAAEGVELRLRQRSARIVLEIDGDARNLTASAPQVNLLIRLPADVALDLSLGVGRIDVSGRTSGLDIDLGVGDVQLALEQDGVSSLRLAVGVGISRIEPKDGSPRRSGFLVGSNDVAWRGASGGATVRVDVGVGAARAALR